jgi:8-oxo-dGTP pyrophosphatase MutT (NUDIX family)
MQSTSRPPIAAVGGIIFRRTSAGQEEIVLIRKRAGLWTLPKGRVEPNESPLGAVQREVLEETGMRGNVVTLVTRIAYEIVKRGTLRSKHVTYYLIEATEGTLCPGADEGIVEAQWFPLGQALTAIGREKIRAVLACAIPHLSPPSYSSEGG